MAASAFQLPVDVLNNAIQLVGGRQLQSWDDVNDRAQEMRSAYDGLRQAELRRNVWTFATRKAYLRPVDTTTILLTPPVYDGSAEYAAGMIATGVGYTGGTVAFQVFRYISTASPPSDAAVSPWDRYFGPMTATPYDSGIGYARGEIVYSPANVDALIYLSLTDVNKNDPTVIPAWDATITYRKGDTVTYLTLEYQSDVDLNLNQTPDVSNWTLVSGLGTQVGLRIGQSWLRLDGFTWETPNILYPVGSGPLSDPSTSNVFYLPYGWLADAPQTPKAGSTSWLGAPWGSQYSPALIENGFIVNTFQSPFVYRFVADIAEVYKMDPMFCQGLGARLGLTVAPRLTGAEDRVASIGASYARFMMEARIKNGIESGPTEPPMDDWLACRY